MLSKRKFKIQARRDREGSPVTNRILCSISETEFNKLKPSLQFVKLPHHQSLHHPSANIDAAYFIDNGLACLIVPTARGRGVEVGVVGCEGLTGVALAAGLRRTTAQALVQIEGSGHRVERAAFEQAVSQSPELRDRLLRFSVIQSMQVAQTAACNRLHNARQRLARWLLMTRDRIGSDVVGLTHEFLAVMLGTDRPTVTIAAKALQSSGAIQYVRKFVRITDWRRLERATCECYFAVRQFNVAIGL
jgi:CRP-like cAMP-binding protein